MRNQLITYVNLLFAGNPEAAEIKEEILQNTLDRYDDLIAQGRTPESAYSLAISGIGDIGELLGGNANPAAAPAAASAESEQEKKSHRLMRSVAVALYILCPVPLFLLQNEWGLCLLLGVVAVATALMVCAGKQKKKEDPQPHTPQEKLKKSVSDLIWTIGTVIYFIVSFATMAWHITWLIFPLLGAIEGLVNACLELKEEN